MTTVSIGRTPGDPILEDVVRVLRRCLDQAGSLKSILRPGWRILIKPNVGVAAPPESARNTDPKVVEATILLLQEAGAGEIIIGESSVVGQDTMESFQISGIMDVAKRTGTQVVDFKREPSVRLRVQDGLSLKTVTVSRKVIEVQAIINLAKLKSISSTPVSFGMKNLKGLMPDSEKKRFHLKGLNHAIADLNSVVRPVMTIIDGILAHELYKPRRLNLLLAGQDVVAGDTVTCAVVGVDPAEVGYLFFAREKGLGQGGLQQIEMRGEPLDSVSTHFEVAPDSGKAFAAMFPEVNIIDGNACSGCTGSLYMGLKTARNKGLLKKIKHMNLAIGLEARPGSDKNRTIYLGKCLRRFKNGHFLDGCPFPFMDFVQYVEKFVK